MVTRKNSLVQTFFIFLASFVILLALGCGGGTVGTGTGEPVGERTLEGSIQYTDGQPVSDATVTIKQTGESTTTDQNGDFSLPTTATEEQLNVEIDTGKTSAEIVVDTNTPDPNEVIQVNVSIDPVKKVTNVKRLNVTAQVQGRCDAYFENGRKIRQSVAIRDNTACEIGVSVRGDRKPLARIPFVVQHSDCSRKKWILESQGVTDETGTGKAGFTFFNTDKKCFYRILVPYQVKGLDTTEFLIYTFHAQSLPDGTDSQSRPVFQTLSNVPTQ